MQRNIDIENALMEAWKEWNRPGAGVFDFDVPKGASLMLKPRSGKIRCADQTIGCCWPHRKKINVDYGTDKQEALHTLLHEMCHLASNGHKADFKGHFAFAANRLTGVKFNAKQPCNRLDADIAEAFGSTARKDVFAIRDQNKKDRKASKEKLRNIINGN